MKAEPVSLEAPETCLPDSHAGLAWRIEWRNDCRSCVATLSSESTCKDPGSSVRFTLDHVATCSSLQAMSSAQPVTDPDGRILKRSS